MMRLTRKAILRAVGCPYLDLVRVPVAGGYFYFIYDRMNTYETHSVYVFRLSDLGIDQWVEEGRAFVRKVETEHAASLEKPPAAPDTLIFGSLFGTPSMHDLADGLVSLSTRIRVLEASGADASEIAPVADRLHQRLGQLRERLALHMGD